MPDDRSPLHEEALEQFVLLWGEMASAWGINKTMAQIHALLYAEEEPLDTDTIMAHLDISRGNANMNLRNLLQWQLIHKIHFKGERKDFYTADKDVWSIVSTIGRERQQREIEPIRRNLEKTLKIGRASCRGRKDSRIVVLFLTPMRKRIIVSTISRKRER